MAHPERALQLLLAPEGPQAHALATELWNLNMERREVEQRVTSEAIAIVEATPAFIDDAYAIVVAGEGWHEGVVGIVASRLVDRFNRPAIVVTMDGDAAKGSGRSLPGVDLHALVASASGMLDRWGGHAGAIGLQLASGQIAAFRGELVAAAASVSASITKARVRQVDAVVGVRDLTLPTAESLESLQPFGTGNPDVRLVVPGCIVENASTMGEGGRHLQVRLRAGAAHARGVGWGMGERVGRIATGERHDAIVQLAVDRWQELIGPKVTLDGLDHLIGSAPVTGQCAQPCDTACIDRVPSFGPQALTPALPQVQSPPGAGPPRGVRDRRGEGRVVSTIAALAGADRGVVAVVADVAHRRVVLGDVLDPARLGVEVAVLGGDRCGRAALAARLATAANRPALILVDYDVLSEITLPDDVHIALVDPPVDPTQAAWVTAHAADRWLHLLWGDEEVAFALKMAERRWDVRAAAAEIWRALRDGDHHPWGTALDGLLLGTEGTMRPPLAVVNAVVALGQIGLLQVDATGIAALPGTGARLEVAAHAMACRTHLDEIRGFLAQVGSLSFDGSAISFVNG